MKRGPADLEQILLRGEPYERGMQHGRAVAKQVRAFLGDHFARINLIRHTPLSPSEISAHVAAHATVIEREVPELAEEIRGLAAGAQITYEQAMLLQLRRELIGAPAGIAGGDCSTVMVRDGSSVMLAQTVDQEGLMASLGQMMLIEPAETGAPIVLLFTFAGLLGYAGLNSSGVAVATNLVTSDEIVPGVPPYLLVREALACNSAAAAVARIEQLSRASARAFTIADRHQTLCCEVTPDSSRSWAAPQFVRTNHFLHPDLVAHERLNVFSLNASRRRLQILEAGVPAVGTDPTRAFALLADHSLYPIGLCAHAEGDMRQPDTAAAIVLRPDQRTMWACRGNPCTATPREYSLARRPS